MKVELDERSISLIPENYAEKLYIARFIKELDENDLNSNIEACFEARVGKIKTCGWADPKEILERSIDVDDLRTGDPIKDKAVAVDEITELNIYPHAI